MPGSVSPHVRIGLIGCGVIAQVMHLHYLTELSDLFEIAAVCDVSLELAQACADRYGVPVATTDWQELLGLQIDAVMVLTPGSHAPIAIAAAEAGKHVFIEKPLAFSVAEGETVVAAAARSGVTMLVGYNKRYDPAFERLQAELETVPDIRLARVTTYESPFEPYVAHYPLLCGAPPAPSVLHALQKDTADRLSAAIGSDAEIKRLYHAVLLDSMVHELNAIRALLGEPDRLDHADLGRHGATLAMRFGEARAVLTWIDLPGFARYGMEFAVFAPERRLKLTFPSPYLRNAAAEFADEHGVPGRTESTANQHVFSYESSFKAELVHFHGCITRGDAPRTPPADALRDIAFCRAIIEAHLSGRPVIAPTRIGDAA